MYPQSWEARYRQHDVLARARQDRQAGQARALRKASRQAGRAQRRMRRAQSDVVRLRGELDSQS